MSFRLIGLFSVFLFLGIIGADAQKTKVEKVNQVCQGLGLKDKPIVAVAPFKYASAQSAPVGTGLSDMLMNALINCGCFRVVERDRLNVIMQEQGLGLSGAGDESSFAAVGKQLGAQVMIMGTITEFSDNESGGGAGVGKVLRVFGKAPAVVAGGAGMRQAHIGYTIRFVNPQTGEIISSQSFDKKVNKVGLLGGGAGGGTVAGGGFYTSKAMEDAVEQSLIEAIEFMSSKRAEIAAMSVPAPEAGPVPDKANCGLLQLPRKPRFMVIIPEEHLAGAGSNYDPLRQNTINVNVTSTTVTENRTSGQTSGNDAAGLGTGSYNAVRNTFRPPDPAGETEIMKRFLEFGFELVDAKQLEKIKAEKQYTQAFQDPRMAAQLASKYGADIIIVGEAFSEYSKSGNGMYSCRARVEVKAVMTGNGQILAADGLHGSGLDVSEAIAGKTALRNAGGKVADYFLVQLCQKKDEIAANVGKKGAVATEESMIKLQNVDFTKASAVLKLIQGIPGVSSAERISFADNTATLAVTHTSSTDAFIEKLAALKSVYKFNIKSIEGNTALIDLK